MVRLFATMWDFRHRIVSTGIPRMAATDAAQRQPQSTERAVGGYGFMCIAGTTWIETAVLAEVRADRQLVNSD